MIDTDICLRAYGYTARISSALGGTCFRLTHDATGAELLRTPKDINQLNENVFLFGNPILYPPNRIKGGTVSFEGRTYPFPINEPQNGCHIHGALYAKAFSVNKLTETTAELNVSFSEGEYLGIPNSFTVKRCYSLGEEGLSEATVFDNLSVFAFPLMLAYHTTIPLPFLPDGDPKSVVLSMPVRWEFVRDSHFIPNGEKRTGDARQQALNAGTYEPYTDTASAFYRAEPGKDILLTDTVRGVSVVYSSDADFAHRMLYSPKFADYVVTEPQTCAIDCFRMPGGALGNGLIVLPPHAAKTLHTRIGIRSCQH